VTAPDDPIDTGNWHMVGSRGGQVFIGLPPIAPMTIEQTLTLAAWLLVVACIQTPLDQDAVEERFARIVEAVRNT